MKFDLFELSVAVPSSSGSCKIPEYGHEGLTYIEGRQSQPFSLKLRNDSAQRVLAVISIDGLNVVDGEPCTAESRGYVIAAYSAVEIKGWRTSLSEIHTFKFEAKDKSYAAGAVGSTQNCGVIAAKFFSEKPKPITIPAFLPAHTIIQPVIIQPAVLPQPTPIWYVGGSVSSSSGVTCSYMGNSTTAGPIGSPGPQGIEGPPGSPEPTYMACADSTTSNVPEFKLGTGWGEAKADYVHQVEFTRERELCTLTLYYAETVDLERVGVRLVKTLAVTPPATPALPQAFSGFCKPPVSR